MPWITTDGEKEGWAVRERFEDSFGALERCQQPQDNACHSLTYGVVMKYAFKAFQVHIWVSPLRDERSDGGGRLVEDPVLSKKRWRFIRRNGCGYFIFFEDRVG